LFVPICHFSNQKELKLFRITATLQIGNYRSIF